MVLEAAGEKGPTEEQRQRQRQVSHQDPGQWEGSRATSQGTEKKKNLSTLYSLPSKKYLSRRKAKWRLIEMCERWKGSLSAEQHYKKYYKRSLWQKDMDTGGILEFTRCCEEHWSWQLGRWVYPDMHTHVYKSMCYGHLHFTHINLYTHIQV